MVTERLNKEVPAFLRQRFDQVAVIRFQRQAEESLIAETALKAQSLKKLPVCILVGIPGPENVPPLGHIEVYEGSRVSVVFVSHSHQPGAQEFIRQRARMEEESAIPETFVADFTDQL